jgi:large subunit ribosomal protein L4
MPAKSFTAEDATAAQIRLADPDKGSQAVHDIITAYRANRRTGSASTKTRGEVRGNNKKIYRQKGTGNARHGDKRAPIFVGGGVVFGPRPRDYTKKVTKSVRRLALRRSLGDRIRGGDVLTVGSFAVADGKTKSFLSAVREITDESRKVLVIANGFDELTFRSARNIGWVQLISAAEVNVEQILHANKIILVEDALETLAKRTA